MSSTPREEVVYQGIAASPGVAHGGPFVYISQELDVPRYQVPPSSRPQEIERFEQALFETRRQVAGIRDEVAERLGEEEARIFDAHQLVLEDVALIEETIREQAESDLNIEACFQSVSQRYIEAFGSMDDPYIKERVTDIRDVARRLLNVLLGKSQSSLRQVGENKIIVAEDLPPSIAAAMDVNRILGIVTDSGSRTSHAVIMARSLQVPAVVGLHDFSGKVEQDDYILVDGYEGMVIVNPSTNTLFSYGQYQKQRQSIQRVFEGEVSAPSVTTDGCPLSLVANIGSSSDTEVIREKGGEGVGLFRTESLFLEKDRFPSEEEQYREYARVTEKMGELGVTIRTLDLGGDKRLSGQSFLHREDNPFMGFRAIRFCLENRDIFKDQLRAILRASTHGKVSLMYPMVSGVEELVQANRILDEAKQELAARDVKFRKDIDIGVMIEIPSAAMTADILARHCSFFSIGTNDLIQYMLAVDRVNDRIAHLYEPSHPGVIRMLKSIMDSARRNRIKVSVCGEMASDPLFLPLLLGLGANELSLAAVNIPELKYYLRRLRFKKVKGLIADILREDSAKAILRILKDCYREHMENVIPEKE